MLHRSPGTQIGNYTIKRVLGSGGFGAVYEAEVLPPLRPLIPLEVGQHIALKEDLGAGSLTQLQQEFAILSQLRHPHLPLYYELFPDGGNAYLVMELVPGQDLLNVIQSNPSGLPESQVLGYALQVCDALSYLHSQYQPILHRDIKPANIRLTADGLVKLVDFGLIKQGAGQTRMSIRGMGTPEYAPLEQYGRGGSTDPRSDIYSLGATIYHLLTGQPPIEAGDRVTAAVDPLQDPRHWNPAISIVVARAVMQALSIRKETRFATAQLFRAALFAQVPPQVPTAVVANPRNSTGFPGTPVQVPTHNTKARSTPAPYRTSSPSQTSGLAVFSLVLGVLAFLTLCTFIGFIPLLLGLVGAILGIAARNQIKQQVQGGDGLALSGIIVGFICAMLGLLELLGLAALTNIGGSAMNDMLTQVSATLTSTQ